MKGTGTLDDADRMRARGYVEMLFGVYEKSYFTNQYGLLGSSEWSRFAIQICVQYRNVLSNPPLIDNMRIVVSTEFIRYIEASCEGSLQ